MLSLALLALLGYLLGRRPWLTPEEPAAETPRLEPAGSLPAKEIEEVAREMRRQLAAHHASLARFRERLTELRELRSPEEWATFCQEAEGLLSPADDLAAQMARAYERIRGHAQKLATFEPVLVDPQTRLPNRHAFDRMLGRMLAMEEQFGVSFAVLLLDIDHLAAHNQTDGPAAGDALVSSVARLIRETVRRTDFVARFGGEEFALLLPHADLTAAAALARRIAAAASEQLSITLTAGVALGGSGDTSRQILARVDAALYSAKSSGRDLYCHAGQSLRPHSDPRPRSLTGDARSEALPPMAV